MEAFEDRVYRLSRVKAAEPFPARPTYSPSKRKRDLYGDDLLTEGGQKYQGLVPSWPILSPAAKRFAASPSPTGHKQDTLIAGWGDLNAIHRTQKFEAQNLLSYWRPLGILRSSPLSQSGKYLRSHLEPVVRYGKLSHIGSSVAPTASPLTRQVLGPGRSFRRAPLSQSWRERSTTQAADPGNEVIMQKKQHDVRSVALDANMSNRSIGIQQWQATEKWLKDNLTPAQRSDLEAYRREVEGNRREKHNQISTYFSPRSLYSNFAKTEDELRIENHEHKLEVQQNLLQVTSIVQPLPEHGSHGVAEGTAPAEKANEGRGHVEELRAYPMQHHGLELDKKQQTTKRDWQAKLSELSHPSKVAAEKTRQLEIEALEKKFDVLKLTTAEAKARAAEDRKHRAAEAAKREKAKEKKEDTALRPLTKEEELMVEDALYSGHDSEVLVDHEPSNIQITRGLMRCLRPGAWLNDEVINCYMDLLKERELREPEKYPKCHFFNTFFYKKLVGNDVYSYKAVKRWTTMKKLGYFLSDCDKARYIVDEVKDKSGKSIDVSQWERIESRDLPEQLNSCDCGVFMVKYADYHARDAPLHFTQSNMDYFRRRMVLELLKLKVD
eukprot:jgi/Mesen1/7197/ME000371S06278